jgi:hypothetical protein
LGDLELIETAELSTATQPITGEIRGPVEIQLEGFRRVHTDVVFVDMEPDDGRYDPLVGYVVLEQSHAAVDMLGHRLVHVKRMDLKQALRRWRPAGPPRASGPGRTYLRLPDDGNRYQIIEGVLYVTPVPGSKSGPGGHATVSGDL